MSETKKESIFDYPTILTNFKDPIGVIKVYRGVKKGFDCRLISAGGGAKDDPEGSEVLKQVKKEAGGDPNIHILDLAPESFFEINAL